MGPIREDLLVFLLFAAFVLVQILRNRQRSKARSAEAEPEPVLTTPAENEPQPKTPAATPARIPWTPPQVEGLRPLPAVRVGQMLPPARPQARRFSRRSLMGDRRSLQEAIVVAAILGPCLAQGPRDTE